jgi:hypothetical protein
MLFVGGACVAVLIRAAPVSASPIVLNGSFEDLNGQFVNQTCGYMPLGAGSTAIADWTVTPSTTGTLVWASSPTCDAFTASNGQFLLDLSGFGASSPNAGLQQSLTTVIGQTYTVTIDLATINNGPVAITVDAMLLSLSAGSPFLMGSTSWTPYTGTFTATSLTSLLTIAKTSPSSDIVFIDNLTVEAQADATVPEPASLILLATGLVGAGLRRRIVIRRI